MSTDPTRRRKAGRWFLLTLILLGLVLYIGSYVRLRRHHDLIHVRSYSGDGTFHSIRPGDSGPSLFAAAALTGQLDQFDSIGAAQQRRKSFHMAFYAPARYAEVLFWRIID